MKISGFWKTTAVTILALAIPPACSRAIDNHSLSQRDALFHDGVGEELSGILDKRDYSWRAPRFDLSHPSYTEFRELKSLHEPTVMQSCGFGDYGYKLYVAQRCAGTPASAGDLCITQLDKEGKYLGHMTLKGFGRGLSIGVQPLYQMLWVEVDADERGYGTGLATFQFENGKTLTASSNKLIKLDMPLPAGAKEVSTAYDSHKAALVVRYRVGNKYRIISWGAGCAATGNYTDVYTDFEIPELPTKSKNLQGYTAYGQFLYMLTGDSKEATGGEINTEITTINMANGQIIQGPSLTRAGESLVFRQPQGLCYASGPKNTHKLYTGFASGKVGDRRASLFYKNVTIPGGKA
ncbi:hypothetical protein B0J15DRAFT_503065 [Fusarium solani]|uniref:P68 RBP/TagC-like beta-propeller domain-containing protein n=1 Tax=Fusarium solani TaxID=169388 RepID=A0A9P9JYH3_FUSSL|nr:uncharacterized protein B0J15DRAFT_503065 [Fusarium solani]KAH7237866.1 hypothetical protein B0J15DRAFT_503065 [Fusarium solani]